MKFLSWPLVLFLASLTFIVVGVQAQWGTNIASVVIGGVVLIQLTIWGHDK